MVTKSYAIPLTANSKQKGDITFEALSDKGMAVLFQLTNASSGGSDRLDLITSKNSTLHHHQYGLTFVGTTASANVSAPDIYSIFNDAKNGDWDYIQAEWTIGQKDYPSPSNQYEIQDNKTYDSNGWPPLD